MISGKKSFLIKTIIGIAAAAFTSMANANDKITLLTNWFAQPAHGGFFQALATGLYEEEGLDVTIRTGGPQVNGIQLLAAGEVDFAMNRDFAVLQTVQTGIPIVTVGAPMQYDTQGLLTHEDVNSMADLKDKTFYIASTAHLYWWPWLKSKYGYDDSQARPYTGSLQPFFADKNVVQQALQDSEPYQAEQQGVKVNFLPFAAEGYPPYRGAVITLQKTIDERPDVVERFLRASMKGWKSFLENPEPAAKLMKEDNPNMTDGEIEYAVNGMRNSKVITGGDAEHLGIGAMTDERWKKTRDFMVEYGLLDPETDWKKAYTLEFMNKIRVLP